MNSAGKKVILMIEDERVLLDSYAEIAASADFVSIKCEDGYKGLEALEAGSGEVDVVLLDLMMPGVDGLEVLRTIRSAPDSYGSAPIIVLTAMTSERVIKEAFDLGAASYLIKTELDVEDLVKEVNKVLSE
jgi:DNA-binding response OmpR family regulator